MDSAERLLKLLGLLEGRIDWTAEDLARRLDVTTRTIRRDVTRLRDLGYPVESLAGPGGGYRLGAGGKLPPLLLDDGEALAVALGLRLTVRAAVSGLEEPSLSALAKLEHLLPPRLRTRLEDVSIATTSTLGASPTSVDHRIFSEAAAAIRAREKLRFDYLDGGGRRSERHVEPVRMVHTGRRWYLVSFDLAREDWRTFRMDRVSNARATGIRFSARKGPDPVALVQSGLSVDVWEHRAVVTLAVGMERARRAIPATIGTVEPVTEASCRLLIGADDLDWLARYLLGLPFGFSVEEPGELRSRLARIGSDLAAEYDAG